MTSYMHKLDVIFPPVGLIKGGGVLTGRLGGMDLGGSLEYPK